MSYFETSAKTGECVNECIEYLVKECLKKVKTESTGNIELKLSPGYNGGCFESFKDFFRDIRSRFK